MDQDETRTLRSGNVIPVLGLGTWQLTNNTAETIAQALEIGYRLIDTSSDYGTQPDIGEALQRTTIDRGTLYITTKVEEDDNSYEATQEYIREMDLEYADLMLIHRPPKTDPGVDLWEGLIRCKNAGFTRDIGVSNYSSEQIEALIAATGEVPVVNQIEWSPFGHSQEMLEYCAERGILVQAYSPLTRGKRLDDTLLKSVSEMYEKSPAQVLLRWNLQLGTIPIPKANQEDHLEENIEIFDFELTDEEMQSLGELNEHYSSLGELPYV